MHWSKTRHVQYEACKRQFFYSAIAGPRNEEIGQLTQIVSPQLARHDVVRQTITQIIANELPAELTAAAAWGQDLLEAQLGRGARAMSEMSIVKACLHTFLTLHLTYVRDGEVLHLHDGGPIEFEYDGLSVMFSPDAVVDYQGHTEVLAWKTGSSRFHDPAAAFLLAGAATCWGQRALDLVHRPIRFRELFLREGSTDKVQELSDDDVRSFVSSARRVCGQYAQSAKMTDFPASAGNACRFCDFKPICQPYSDHFEPSYDLDDLRAFATANASDETSGAAIDRHAFLSHASADKEKIVRPVERALRAKGYSCWLDEAEIGWGDSIAKNVNQGLRCSEYVIVFITEESIERGWPENEMNSTISRENADGRIRVLPVVDMDHGRFVSAYPLLADKTYLRWSDGVDHVVREFEKRLNRDHMGL